MNIFKGNVKTNFLYFARKIVIFLRKTDGFKNKMNEGKSEKMRTLSKINIRDQISRASEKCMIIFEKRQGKKLEKSIFFYDKMLKNLKMRAQKFR